MKKHGAEQRRLGAVAGEGSLLCRSLPRLWGRRSLIDWEITIHNWNGLWLEWTKIGMDWIMKKICKGSEMIARSRLRGWYLPPDTHSKRHMQAKMNKLKSIGGALGIKISWEPLSVSLVVLEQRTFKLDWRKHGVNLTRYGRTGGPDNLVKRQKV